MKDNDCKQKPEEMSADEIIALVTQFPAKTTAELAKALGMDDGTLNFALDVACRAGIINRVIQPGMRKQSTALRHYLPPRLRLHKKSGRGHVYTICITSKARPAGAFLNAKTFPDLIVALLPQLDKEDLQKIIAAAVAERLDHK